MSPPDRGTCPADDVVAIEQFVHDLDTVDTVDDFQDACRSGGNRRSLRLFVGGLAIGATIAMVLNLVG